MAEDLIIKVVGVSKEYRLGTIDHHSFINELKNKEDGRKKLMALDNVSFEMKRGEAIGIIGGNGAGKSTLLKILSRITTPSEGEVYMDGTISSMLEVGTGFHPELSGRENIYINGTILGMTKKEIDSKLDDIIEFSECRDFIDTPVKRYSSGMYVKLAFSVAAFLESEIMILDEVLSVGDVKFQNKCLTKIQELIAKEGRTVICVSHNMNTIKKFCDRCLVLDHGKLIFDGDTKEAIRMYYGDNFVSEIRMECEDSRRFTWLSREDVRLISAEYIGKEDAHFEYDENIIIKFKYKFNKSVSNLCFRFEVYDDVENPIATSFVYNIGEGNPGDIKEFTAKVDISLLKEGKYRSIYTFFERDNMKESVDLDCINGLKFVKEEPMSKEIEWKSNSWGNVELPALEIIGQK